jgi:hypothetical protein
MILIYLIIAVALVYFVTVTADYLKTKKKLESIALRLKDLSNV